MSHLVEKMFSAREVPWHFKWTKDRTLVTPDRLTMEEAIPASGLDWTVSTVPIFIHDEHDGFIGVPGKRAIRRSSDGRVLGVHSDGYVPNQPASLFEWGWNIIQASLEDGVKEAAVWETGGSLAGGKRIFAMIKLPDTVRVNGDELVPYLGLADSYDGTLARRAWMTFLRVVCQNTLDWSWSSAVTKIAIRHTKNSKHRIAAARHALGISYSNIEAFESEAQRMIETEITNAEFEKLITQLFPINEKGTDKQRTNGIRRRNTVRQLYRTSPTVAPYSGTTWGALNAIQEWEQWSARAATSKLSPRKVADKQLQKIVSGTWPVTNKAAARLLVK